MKMLDKRMDPQWKDDFEEELYSNNDTLDDILL